MALNVKLRSRTVEVILDQDKAEEIYALGVKLAGASASGGVSEAGGNPIATGFAEQIEQLRKDAKKDTLVLELEALPFSKWQAVVRENTVTKGDYAGMQDQFGLVSTAIPQMLKSAMLGGKPLPEEDMSADALHDLFGQLTDGQFTPLWEAVRDLNTSRADPKAASDLALTVLRKD